MHMVYCSSAERYTRTAREINERKDCSLKTEQRVITASQILRDKQKSDKKVMSKSNTNLESLILAQDERWRRA